MRPKTYPHRPKANRVARLDANGKVKVIWLDDPGGTGREVVREATACAACAAKLGD
jgi:hypothetical protein